MPTVAATEDEAPPAPTPPRLVTARKGGPRVRREPQSRTGLLGVIFGLGFVANRYQDDASAFLQVEDGSYCNAISYGHL